MEGLMFVLLALQHYNGSESVMNTHCLIAEFQWLLRKRCLYIYQDYWITLSKFSKVSVLLSSLVKRRKKAPTPWGDCGEYMS